MITGTQIRSILNSQREDTGHTSIGHNYGLYLKEHVTKRNTILAGTFEPPEELVDTAKWLLTHCNMQLNQTQLTGDSLEEDFFEAKQVKQVWNEHTSTSPITNDVHLGHAKAYFAPHDALEPNSEEEEILEDNRTEF